MLLNEESKQWRKKEVNYVTADKRWKKKNEKRRKNMRDKNKINWYQWRVTIKKLTITKTQKRVNNTKIDREP